MKVFKGKETQKSWALKLFPSYFGDASLDAVDSETGMVIVNLIRFERDGRVTRLQGVKAALKCDGYDPYEHGNSFNESDQIKIN